MYVHRVVVCIVYILQYCAREHNIILSCLRAVHHGPPLCHKRGESNRSLARRDNRCGTHPTTAAAAELSHSIIICYYYFIYITARNIMHNATARTTTGAKRFIGFRRSGWPDKTANLYSAYTPNTVVYNIRQSSRRSDNNYETCRTRTSGETFLQLSPILLLKLYYICIHQIHIVIIRSIN